MHSWLQIACCFGAAVFLIFIFGVAGRLVAFFNLGEGRRDSIFSFSALVKGMMLCISLYAIIITGGKTILLPLPLLLLVFERLKKESALLPEEKENLLKFILPCLAVHFLYYLQAYLSFDASAYTYPGGDHLFYSRLIQNINLQNTENPRIEYLFPFRFGVEPYHWGDMWLGAFINGTTKINQHYAFLLVASPVLSALFAAGIYTYVKQLFPSQAKKGYLFALVVFAPLLSGFPFTYPEVLYKPFIFIKSAAYYPKVLWVGLVITWLLLQVRARAWNKALVVCCIGMFTFVNILPAVASGTSLFFGILLLRKKVKLRALIPAIAICIAAAGYFLFFYASSKPTDTAVYTMESQGLSLTGVVKLMGMNIAKGILQLSRLIPYLVLLFVLFWRTPRKAIFNKFRSIPVELQFLFLLLGAGLLCWGALTVISRDAMQCFQNLYMPALSVLIIVLMAYAGNRQDFSRYANLLAAAVILLNLAFHFRFDYQINSVTKADFAAASAFTRQSNGRMVNIKSPVEMASKYSANTILEEPLGFLDYTHTIYVNASLNIFFVQFTDVEPYQKADIQSVVEWAPIAYFIQKKDTTDREKVMLGFTKEINAQDIAISPGTVLPVSFQKIITDSLQLSNGWRIYKCNGQVAVLKKLPVF